MTTPMTTPATTETPVWRVLLGYVRPFRLALLGGGVVSLITSATGLGAAADGARAARRSGLAARHHRAAGADERAGDRQRRARRDRFVPARTDRRVGGAAGRRDLVTRLLHLRVAEVDRAEPGDLMSRVTSDTTLLRSVTTQSLLSLVTSVITLVATVTLMALLDPLLLGVTVVVLGLSQVVVRLVVPRIARAAGQVQASVGILGANLERARCARSSSPPTPSTPNSPRPSSSVPAPSPSPKRSRRPGSARTGRPSGGRVPRRRAAAGP
jgi:hypothetical protein